MYRRLTLLINHNNSYKAKMARTNMKTKIIFVTSMMLFVLVLIGVYTMSIIAQDKDPAWLESFAPLIILTGFFIFIISAGLFIYGIIKSMKKE